MKAKPKYTPEELQGALVRRAEPARIQALRIVSMLGGFAAALGGANLSGIAGFLPPDVAGWLLTVGLFAGASKQGLLILGDMLDNGKRDNSFSLGDKVPLILIGLLSLFFFSSCNGLRLNVNGDCVTAKYERGGNTYEGGPCVNPVTGEVDRFVSYWFNAEGVRLEATYNFSTKEVDLRYQETPGGLWVNWSSKSGISLDGAPPEAHLENV